MIDYNELLNNGPSNGYDFLHWSVFDAGLNPSQANIVRLLHSKREKEGDGYIITDKDVNCAVEVLVHHILGGYIGSEYGDVIECREGIPEREESILFINEALQELR